MCLYRRSRGFRWIFKNYSVKPTGYCFAHAADSVTFLRNWNLEGSTDQRQWKVISAHQDDTSLNKKDVFVYWDVKCEEYFRFIRMRITGETAQQNLYLVANGFELYGTLKNDKQ